MRLFGVLVALAALLFAPAAIAKEITKVTACGSDDCVTTRDPAILQGLMNGGPPTVPPKVDGGVIELSGTITASGEAVGRTTSWWQPAARLLVAEDGTWMRLPARAERSLQRVTGALAPFPASRAGLAAAESTPAPTPAAAPTSSGNGPGVSWLVLLLPVGAAAAAAAALLARRRRRPPVDAAKPAAS